MILVTSYQDPDLDGTACAVGEAEVLLLKDQEAVAGVFGKLHKETEALIQTFGLERPLYADELVDRADEIVIVDASDLRGLSPRIDPKKVTRVIDHRKDFSRGDFPNADFQIELVGSAATLVTEHFVDQPVAPSRTAAYLLAGAIVSNTVNFQSNVTTSRDRAMYEWLRGQVEIPDTFVEMLFESKSTFTHEHLFEEIEHDVAWFLFGDKKIGIAQLEIVRAGQFLDEFSQEILTVIKRLEEQNQLDTGFLTIIDIDKGNDIFLCENEWLRTVLTEATGVVWDGNQATTSGIMMRKEIVPLLRKILD